MAKRKRNKQKERERQVEELALEKEERDSQASLEEEAAPEEGVQETTPQADEEQAEKEKNGQPTLEERVAALEDELEQVHLQAEQNLDGWQRALADFSNFRKRIERERQQTRQEIKAEVLRGYLEIADDLERALQNRPEEGQGAEWAGGIELIYRKLMTMLENEGVTPIEADGHKFDPNLHEAISQQESDDHESEEIIEVVQRGYMLGERVLRPAQVRIAS